MTYQYYTNTNLKHKVSNWLHAALESGHSGRDITIRKVKSLFYQKGLTKEVRLFVSHFQVCQAPKYDTTAHHGLLQPLPIPEAVWIDISPKSGSYDVIFVVVDRLNIYNHFIALSHPFTTIEVAQIYLDNVFKLHGQPRSIVSDRDCVFLSHFWIVCSASMGLSLFSPQPTILKQMVKLRLSINAYRLILGACLVRNLKIGILGYPLLNGGIKPIFIQPFS